MVDFEWFPGMAVKQAQRSIESLHSAARSELEITELLEISTKSKQALGVELSAFNLTFTTKKYAQTFSVEAAYQSSKVFESGGPYVDLLQASPRDAKRDPRLSESGRILKFTFFGVDWALEPRTAFYDWLYINALHRHESQAAQLCDFEAFTDIAFNPERSINCQAYAAALYVALVQRRLLTDEVLMDRQSFLRVVAGAKLSGSAREDQARQNRLAL